MWRDAVQVLLIVVAGLATVVVVSFVAAVVYLRYGFSDPLEPEFSAAEAIDAVARELCPENPQSMESELIAGYDSFYYRVYVRADDHIAIQDVRDVRRDTLGSFRVAMLDDGTLDVEPSTPEDDEFVVETRAACAEGRDPLSR